MKKLFMILLALAMGCATSNVTTVRDTYMDRAYSFDKKYTGEEFTPAYRWCYSVWFTTMFLDCQPQLEDGVDSQLQDAFWVCADGALDKMEQCMEVNHERDR